MPQRSRWNALVLCLLLPACAVAPPAARSADDAPLNTAATRRPAAASTLEGRVMAPANVLGGAKLIGPDGATLIGMDGASLIGADGASLASKRGASLLAIAERGLAGAEVVLVDAAGKPLPGIKPATTDADGRFKLAGAPAGSFRLLAGVRTAGGTARLEALVRPELQAGGAEVSAASTLVTRLVAAAPKAAAMDPKRWSEAVAACAKALDDQALPDWSDPAGVDRAARAAMAASAEMRPVVEALARDMGMAMAAPPSAAPATATPAPPASAAPPVVAASVAPASAAPPSPTPTVAPSPVEEVIDPRTTFRRTEAEASAWSYYWLAGEVATPMTLSAIVTSGSPTWIGGTEPRQDDIVGFSTVFVDDQYFYLDPSTTRLEGAAAAWTAPVAGSVRVVGYLEVNANTTNGVTVSVRNGDAPIASEVLTAAKTITRIDTGPFDVRAGEKVWLRAQPNAMPETTDIVKCQVVLRFTRPGP